MPGPGRALWPPSAITASSRGSGSGHLAAAGPITRAVRVRLGVAICDCSIGRAARPGGCCCRVELLSQPWQFAVLGGAAVLLLVAQFGVVLTLLAAAVAGSLFALAA